MLALMMAKAEIRARALLRSGFIGFIFIGEALYGHWFVLSNFKSLYEVYHTLLKFARVYRTIANFIENWYTGSKSKYKKGTNQ